MTDPLPEWLRQTPNLESLHNLPDVPWGGYNGQGVPLPSLPDLADFVKLFLEKFLERVVMAVVGFFVPGVGSFEQLQEWAQNLGSQIVSFIYANAGINLASWDDFVASLADGKGIDLPLLKAALDGLSGIFGGLDLTDLPTPAEVWQQVADTFLGGIFSIPADVQAAINAALGDVQDALNGTYAGGDPILLAVKALAEAWLTATSALNAANIFGRLGLGQFGGGVPLNALTPSVANELEPFSAASVPTSDGWSFNAAEDAAQLVCDGSPKALYLKSGVIKVEEGQPLDTSIDVKYSGVVSGAGQTIRLVLETFTTDNGSGTATPVIVGAVTNPSGTITTPVTLGDSSWDIPAGVKSVRPVLEGDELITAGTVFWKNTPELYKKLAGPLEGGLPAAIQARIDAMQATWDKFKGAAGGTVDDIEDALNGAGQAIRDAIANALGHAGTGHTSANILTYLQSIPQTVVSGLGDLNTLTNQIRDILAGLVVTPINSTVAAIKDWFTGVVGKTQNLTSGGTLPPTSVSGVGGASTIAEAIEDTWNKFWDGIHRTTGSTGKTTADVLSAATQVADAADAAQNSTETLAGFFNTPRLVPSWLATQADDVSFATTQVDGTTAPALGQLVLIPVLVTQDRIYDAIKFGIAATTMTNCYVGLYDCDESTGNLTKVLDLGDCKSSLNTSYNQQIVPLPLTISVQRGELYYIGVLQVGGTAAAMHRWSSTQTFTTGLYPKYPGNSYATTGISAMPSTIAVADVLSGTRFWGALGTATTPVAPGAVFLSDNFNRADASNLGASWTIRSDSVVISGNQATGSVSGNGTATYNTRLSSASQRVGMTFSYGSNTKSAGVTLRGNGLGAFVLLRVSKGASGVDPSAIINTCTAYSSAGTNRASVSGLATGQGNWVFEAVGNVYTGYQAGVQRITWTDSGGAFPVAGNFTEVGLRAGPSLGYIDNWFAQDL